jgi:hypothetical protein
MTPVEYVQLKAFARVDGAWVALLWAGSFACYVAGLANPMLSMLALLLALISPFFIARRLRAFRDEARDGVISFLRGWAFVILVFFYGGLLFALMQYGYFAYMDRGYMLQSLHQMMSTPEAEAMLKQYGMGQAMAESLQQLQSMRPIDMALNVLTMLIMLGVVLGLPIAALMRNPKQDSPDLGAHQ